MPRQPPAELEQVAVLALREVHPPSLPVSGLAVLIQQASEAVDALGGEFAERALCDQQQFAERRSRSRRTTTFVFPAPERPWIASFCGSPPCRSPTCHLGCSYCTTPRSNSPRQSCCGGSENGGVNPRSGGTCNFRASSPRRGGVSPQTTEIQVGPGHAPSAPPPHRAESFSGAVSSSPVLQVS